METRQPRSGPNSTQGLDPDALTLPHELIVAEHAATSELRSGGRLGRYVVVDEIGAGAMGVVFRAYDPDLDRRIALKVVRVRGSNLGSGHQREVRLRLLREAQAIARVTHPNVIAVYDVGMLDEGVFVAMEFVEGDNLKRWLARNSPSWRKVVDIFLQAGRGLAAAHDVDLVHRDFKPDNVMLGRDGRVRVLDFGLARAMGNPGSSDSTMDEDDLFESLDRRDWSLEVSLTAQGTVVGTPAYMAPEQHLGKKADARADQFSFCVALWEALYGVRPFTGDTPGVVARAIVRGDRQAPPSDVSLPRHLQALLDRGLQTRPAQRFDSMHELLEQLGRDPSRRWKRTAASVGVLGLVAGSVGLTRAATVDEQSCDGATEHIEPVWNASRRAALAKRFERSGFGFASDSWRTVERRMDAFVSAWNDEYVEACRATKVRGDQSSTLLDQRMLCLERTLADAEAVLDVLASPDDRAVVGAVDAIAGLSDLGECRDIETLLSRQTPRLSDERAQTAEQLSRRLREIRARVRAGLYQGLLEQLERLAPEVERLDHPPLAHELHWLEGLVRLEVGESHEARRSWERAFETAIVGRDFRAATRSASKLAYVVGHRLAQIEQGRFWLELGRSLLDTIDDDGALEASFWQAEGNLEATAGRAREALDADQKAYDYWRKREPGSWEHAVTAGNFATGYRLLGELDRAIELTAEALEITESLYGESHPETALARRRHAAALQTAGRNEEAKKHLEKALAHERVALGPTNMRVATTLDILGKALRKLGSLEEAQTRHLEALKIFERELGPTHPDVAVAYMNLGYTAADAHDWTTAYDYFTRAGEVFEQALGPEHASMIHARLSRGRMQLELGHHAQAVELLEAARTMDAADDLDPTLLAEVEFVLARAMVGAHPSREREARALATSALARYREREKHWKPQIAEIEAWLADRSD